MSLDKKPSLIKPKIGGDPDVWGNKLNENIDKQDLFNQKIVEDSSSQDQELARLEQEKLSRDDLDTVVSEKVDNYIEVYGKVQIDEHITTVSKPDISNYVEGKKAEINQYVQTVSKPDLDSHTNKKKSELDSYNVEKKSELDAHTLEKKSELDAYEKVKEGELDTYNETKKSDLDKHEKLKEGQLDEFTNLKKVEITEHTNTEKENITSHTNSKKSEITDFTESKKAELDFHEKVKESELDEFNTIKKGELDEHTAKKSMELDSHTGKKKEELDAYEKVKEGELDAFTIEEKKEITQHTATQKDELTEFTNSKKIEVTQHTNSKKDEITKLTEDKKLELDAYEKSKEGELDLHTTKKEKQLDAHTLEKIDEINTATDEKKAEIVSLVEDKKVEINSFTEGEKSELDLHEKEKEKTLDSFTEVKKIEVTTHTDEQIERITALGIDGKLDKEIYEADKKVLEQKIDSKVSLDKYNQDMLQYEVDKSDILSKIGEKVSKAGDTMSGTLNLPEIKITQNNKGVINSAGNSMLKNTSTNVNDVIVGNTLGKATIESSSNPSVRLGEGQDYVIYHEGNRPTKGDIGLSEVDNTSDINKNVLSATKFTTARNINGVPFDGTEDIVITAVPREHNHNELYYQKNEVDSKLSLKADISYVDTKISDLVDSSPEALDTLKELSNALGNDPNFATTVMSRIGEKADKTTQIVAGNGLAGGGDLTTSREINIVSGDDSVVVNPDNIIVNTYNGVDSTSSTRPASSNAVKTAYDKGVEAVNIANTKLDANGNAVSASKLQTPVTINDTYFDGTGHITTAKWGATRRITIGKQGADVDGANNLTWTLEEMGAVKDIVLPIQRTSYRRSVVGLVKLTGASDSSFDSYIGDLIACRINSLNGALLCKIYVSDPHEGDNQVGFSVFGTLANNVRGCTFVKNGIKYGGFEFYVSDAEYSRVHLHGALSNSNGNEPYVALDYVETNGTVLDEEINSSINFDNVISRATSFICDSEIYANKTQRVYHQGFKPTKTDVGLDQVQNWTVTSSVSDPSNDKYATAGAVKQAYDRGSEAINIASGKLDAGGTAVSSSKLATPRAINGTWFDGTGDITTSFWGTTRNITIGRSTKSVNGSGDISWSYSDMGVFQSNIGVLGDFNAYRESGVYKINIEHVNAPYGYAVHGTLFVAKGDGDTLFQTYVNYTDSSAYWVRSANNISGLNGEVSGVWQPWVRMYSEGFKPTSTDVGLGNVNNWGASSDINANSGTEYATTNMVAQVRNEKLNYSDRDTWNDRGTIHGVIGQLAWKNYGNGHTIFDASQGISPTGTSVDRNNPSVEWSGSYPTLMGWNGSNTYGVRVDIARKAEVLVGFDPNGIVRDGGQYGTIHLNNWIRTHGNCGWYSETYGGGWYMTDGTWIRTYNNRPIHVAGADITCTNNIIAYYSDVRLKKNFRPVENALHAIMSINPYYYEQNDFAKELGYNEEGKVQIGFKAQEMEKILPQVIQEAPVNHRNDLSDEIRAKIGDEPIKTIDYGKITPLLWKAIQELTEKVTNLELEIAMLKAKGGENGK